MRHFIGSQVPAATRILIIESGSRQIVEQAIPALRLILGQQMEIDIVTCYAGEPAGLRHPAMLASAEKAQVFNVNDYDGPAGRHRLLADLLHRQYPIVAVLCSAEPILTKWKWWLGAKLPSKILIVNENADFFWLDWARFATVREFASYRIGLTGASAIPALTRLVFFPVIFTYMLLYAATVHTRRKLRLS